MISEENSRMLALLADVLHDRTPDPIPADQWPALRRELQMQTVYALPAEFFPALGLSADDAGDYLRAVIKNRQTFHRLMKDQTRFLALLDDAGIPAVVLKGAAAAISYAHPENRCMGDIDLLVLPQDFDRAFDTLIAAGCTKMVFSSENPRHTDMKTPNGTVIELHNYFSTSDNDEQNGVLDGLLFRAIPSRVFGTLCGYRVPMLPTAVNGLVLLGHINQHLSTGLGLRQIIDWMEYVEANLDDAAWEAGFAEMAEQIGMKRLAMIATAMCQKYLGLQKDIHWCSYEPVCDELMEYILSNGNFGRKEASLKRQTVIVLKHFRSPAELLRTAQSNGLLNWEPARKHRVLRPFAWCYQLGRWAVKGVRNGVTADLLSNASESMKEMVGLMEKLGVTRV